MSGVVLIGTSFIVSIHEINQEKDNKKSVQLYSLLTKLQYIFSEFLTDQFVNTAQGKHALMKKTFKNKIHTGCYCNYEEQMAIGNLSNSNEMHSKLHN